jgi:phospho-N-acetylmuramoyl-pentapeptide-transferase
MLFKISAILLYSLLAFFIALALYPPYIRRLQKTKLLKQIREGTITGDASSIFSKLHAHKWGTPTMWWGIILLTVLILVLWSIVLQYIGYINNSLFTRQETYILLFALFSMWILGLVDDVFNILWKWAIKWLSSKVKFIAMFSFSAFITYWFVRRLWVDYVTIRPTLEVLPMGRVWPAVMFVFTVWLVNAINITDGLDGLVWGMMIMVLGVLGVLTFVNGRFLATSLIWIVSWALLAFLWFNINPAKIFMGDSGSLALGGFVASLVYLLNINFWIIIPFMIMMSLFWVEMFTSLLQILSKKYLGKKLFKIAPFHHLLEHEGYAEHSIVMKFWVVQGILCAIALICLLYQL